jgi:hypothetical protein
LFEEGLGCEFWFHHPFFDFSNGRVGDDVHGDKVDGVGVHLGKGKGMKMK